MAFDQENHTLDPDTGYAIDKDTGRRIGIDPAPHLPVNRDPDWPKWVVAHDSHIQRRKVEGVPDVVSTPGWPDSHVNRVDGSVTVLVRNEDEEKLAMGAAPEPGAVVPAPDEAVRRSVRADVDRALADQAIARTQAAANERAKLEAEEVARRMAANQEKTDREKQAAADLAKAEHERMDKEFGALNDADRRRVLAEFETGKPAVEQANVRSRVASDQRKTFESEDAARASVSQQYPDRQNVGRTQTDPDGLAAGGRSASQAYPGDVTDRPGRLNPI
jgi:hypothetical protein